VRENNDVKLRVTQWCRYKVVCLGSSKFVV